MLFGKHKANVSVQIKIDNVIIKKVEETAFLGVIIHEKICWKPQIKNVCSKIAKSVGVMRRVKHILNFKSLLLLYYAFVFPYLNYCVEVWGNTYNTNLHPLIILQKRTICIVCNVKHNEHTNDLFLRAAVLKFQDLIKLKTVQITYRAKHNQLPDTIQRLFCEREGAKRYDLRGKHKLAQQLTRTTLKSMCVSVYGVILWNGLAENIRNSKNLSEFKRKFKQQMFELYSKGEGGGI